MLFLGYFVFSSARVPGPLDTPTPASLSSTHGPAAWTEIVPAARLKGHEQARLDRRTTLGPATRSELGTTSLEAHVPILLHRTLHPGMKSPRVLILNETVGVVAGAAARHAGIELVVSWLNRALEKAFSAPLLSRAAREGRSIASRANANRWFLDTHPGRFHVIVDQHPGASVDGALDRRTAGYFQAVRQALQPAGLYCLWIPFDRLGSAEEVNHLASAFCAVFPTSHQVVTPGLLSLRPVLGWIGTADDAPIPWEGVLEHPATASHFDTSLCPELSTPSSLAAQLVAAAWPTWPAGSTHGPTQAPFHRYHGCFLDPTPSPEETLKAYESFLPAARLDPDPDPAEPSASASRSDMARTVREAARRILQVQRLEQRAALGDLPAAQARDAALTLARALLDQTGNLPAIWPFLDHVARWCRTDGLRDEALGLFEQAVRQAPDWGGGYQGLASFVFERYRNFRTPDQWRELETLAEKALARDPGLARAWIYRGVIHYLARNDSDEARKCFENAAMIDPEDPLMKSWLWLFMDQDGRVEEAAAMLLDALEAYPRDTRLLDALYKLVPRLRVAGKHRQALYVLKTLAPYFERESGYYLLLFEVLEAMGDLPGAVDAIRTCCRLVTPPVQGYYLHLYRLLKKVGSSREAEDTRTFMIHQFKRDPEKLLSGDDS